MPIVGTEVYVDQQYSVSANIGKQYGLIGISLSSLLYNYDYTDHMALLLFYLWSTETLKFVAGYVPYYVRTVCL